MATIDLGKVAFVWKGTYNSGTTYEEKDVVQYTDSGELSSYIYVNASSASGQTPSTGGTVNTTYWSKMAGGISLSVGNNKIVTTDSSGNVSSVALGSANQQLRVNSGGSALEFATIQGFDGNYKLHHVERYSYTGSSISVASVSSGSSDNQKDCILINGGNYLTITPAHADDYFRFESGCNFYRPSNNAYGGLGFMTSTATDFSANRNFFFRSGQHSIGNGSAGGDEYDFKWFHWAGKCSEVGLTAGTTYYVRAIGQKHSTSNTVIFAGSQGNGNDHKHYMSVQHWKKQT